MPRCASSRSNASNFVCVVELQGCAVVDGRSSEGEKVSTKVGGEVGLEIRPAGDLTNGGNAIGG
jgi:hypothetical protein